MAISRVGQEWPEGTVSELSAYPPEVCITDLYRVIERGRTTGYVYAVTKPLLFHAAESFAFSLRSISKQGGHEVSCYFVVPETSSVLPDSLSN